MNDEYLSNNYIEPKFKRVFYWKINYGLSIETKYITYQFSNIIIGRIVAENKNEMIIEISEDYPKIIEGLIDKRLMFSYSKKYFGDIIEISVIKRD